MTVSPIDPLAPTVAGRYEDPLVVVRAGHGGARPRRELRSVRTPHFDVVPHAGRLHVIHTVPPEDVDDDLAGLLADELFGPGWLRGADIFERIFTGVVRTSAEGVLESWEVFYRNTLTRLAAAAADTGRGQSGHGSIAAYAPVHAHARGLVLPGAVLELGCCFGFLALQVARDGHPVTASDVSPGTVDLLGRVAPRLGVSLATVTADAARFPGTDGYADTVLAIHLLEHLEPAHGDAVMAEAVRLARRRVVVAVPVEEQADETYGHVRTVSLADLDRWGRRTGRPYDVHEHHGGWLVVAVDG